MTIRVLFFDLDETLVAQEAAFSHAYRVIAEWLCRERLASDSPAVTEAIPRAAERALDASPLAAVIRRCRFGGRDLLWGSPGTGGGATPLIRQHIEPLRKAAWNTLLKSPSVDVPPRDLSSIALELQRRFRAAMHSGLSLYPDVRPALERLAEDYRLGIITNGLGGAQREKLARLGIDSFFASLTASGEVGIGKPARDIFAAALESVGAAPGEALMIGDSLEGDVRGARNAGICTRWLDRTRVQDDRPESSGAISGLCGWSPTDSRVPCGPA